MNSPCLPMLDAPTALPRPLRRPMPHDPERPATGDHGRPGYRASRVARQALALLALPVVFGCSTLQEPAQVVPADGSGAARTPPPPKPAAAPAAVPAPAARPPAARPPAPVARPSPPAPAGPAPVEPAPRPLAPAPLPVPVPSAADREARALVARHLPARLRDREGWARDIHGAFLATRVPVVPENVCAVIALAEQESGLDPDPSVPGLAAIAAKEIERRRESHGLPRWSVDAALALKSSNGIDYRTRLAGVRTEGELSEIFDDFLSNVPFGKQLFGRLNPVRTGGSMQVSISFAEEQVRRRAYPYPMKGDVRPEVFTRHGGVYFGTAFLLDYPANYSSHLFRFADFNAGRYASRNAAFQQAVAMLAKKPLRPDGDLLIYRDGRAADEPSETVRAVRSIASRLGLAAADIDADLAQEKTAEFEQTRTWRQVFAAADQAAGRPLARELLPRIELVSPKIRRKLTTAWFAERVQTRFRDCLARAER